MRALCLYKSKEDNMSQEIKVLYRKFGKYAGPYIKPLTKCFSLPEDATHLERAFWLATCVESSKGPKDRDGGKFGTINSYDGCGLTGGLHQSIAVYPREIADPDGKASDDQGTLFKMLHLIAASTKTSERWTDNTWVKKTNKNVTALLTAFEEAGVYIGEDGRLRYLKNRKIVAGKPLREMLTPNNGKTPKSGPLWKQAAKWAKLHRAVFADPSTFQAQIDFGLNHIVHFCKSRRPQLTRPGVKERRAINEVVYGESILEAPDMFEVMGPHDLAMCVFLSHSINAPSIALRKLGRALSQVSWEVSNPSFPFRLIKLLDCNYGRWDDDCKGGRYQRTRNAAMKVWPKELFVGSDAIMPKDLPG